MKNMVLGLTLMYGMAAWAEGYHFALKYVVFSDQKGKPLVTEAQVQNLISNVDKIWSQCNVSFELVDIESADANDNTLRYNPAHETDMYVNYERFKSQDSLLIVSTGKFTGIQSHSTGYASYPWRPIPGAATIPKSNWNLDPHNIAHELGHVLGLDHTKDKKHVMNGTIGNKNPKLNPDDCEVVKKNIQKYLTGMLFQK